MTYRPLIFAVHPRTAETVRIHTLAEAAAYQADGWRLMVGA
jgi:hypothetical protein